MIDKTDPAVASFICKLIAEYSFVFITPTPSNPPESEKYYCSQISFAGEINGAVCVKASKGLLDELVDNITDDAQQQDSLLQDATGEITNLLTGHLLTELYGENKRVEPSVPQQMNSPQQAQQKIIWNFASDEGYLSVELLETAS